MASITDLLLKREIFAEENFAFSSIMQFSQFYFRIFTATVRVGNSLNEFLCGKIFEILH